MRSKSAQKGPLTNCLKTAVHRFWTMRIEAYYKLSMAEESRIQAATTWRYRLRLSSSSSASATPSSESLAHQLVKAL
jgi:hypothetical protein